ncbi:hypothetical protein [Inhella proteolytica]|uniref:Uncharacterized protein n=1 Tax=Inhella proteolytica TaxID=2795029 RepID=A0A931J4V6_9BURK|nr:hypothetical protein [Inhella proteolytica]MBH9579651.1 hypothetical protein [Inhella proteolytica]
MQSIDILDLRSQPLQAAVAQVLAQLNTLPADQPLELLLDQDASALRQALQAEVGPLAWADMPAGRVRLAKPSQSLRSDSCCSGGACCG